MAIKIVKISTPIYLHFHLFTTESLLFADLLFHCSVISNKKGLQNYGRLKQLDKHTNTCISTCSQQNLSYWQFGYSAAQLFQTKRDYRITAIKTVKISTLTLTFIFPLVHYSTCSYCSIIIYFNEKKGLQNYSRLKQVR